MTAVTERIKKIQQYFKGCNIANETTFVLVSFPQSWQTFDEKILNERFNVYTGKKDEGIYFVTETINGTDCLFDAIDYVVELNKSIEQKQELLQIKAKELTELFINEPLEKLKTLEFVFSKQKQVRKKKIEPMVKESKKVDEPINNVIDQEKEVTEITKEQEPETKSKPKVAKKKKQVEDSDTMSFLKDLTGEN